jgi:hypothetical protein
MIVPPRKRPAVGGWVMIGSAPVRRLSWPEIFPFEGSYGADALNSIVDGMYLLVVRHGGELII